MRRPVVPLAAIALPLVLAASARAESAPSCSGADLHTTQGRAIRVVLDCSDPDGDPVTRSVTADPRFGSLSGTPEDGIGTYTPRRGFAGTDSFTFTASDGMATSAPATITITVKDVLAPKCRSLDGRAGSLQDALDHGFATTLQCNEKGRVTLHLVLGAGAARRFGLGRRPVTIGSGSARVSRDHPATLEVAFTRRARRVLGERRPRRLSATLTGTATDRQRNRRTLRRTVVFGP